MGQGDKGLEKRGIGAEAGLAVGIGHPGLHGQHSMLADPAALEAQLLADPRRFRQLVEADGYQIEADFHGSPPVLAPSAGVWDQLQYFLPSPASRRPKRRPGKWLEATWISLFSISRAISSLDLWASSGSRSAMMEKSLLVSSSGQWMTSPSNIARWPWEEITAMLLPGVWPGVQRR